MILLYTLERADVFPADDYHIKQILAKKYGVNLKSKTKSTMKTLAAAWAPHRSIAVRYLLAWKEFNKKK